MSRTKRTRFRRYGGAKPRNPLLHKEKKSFDSADCALSLTFRPFALGLIQLTFFIFSLKGPFKRASSRHPLCLKYNHPRT